MRRRQIYKARYDEQQAAIMGRPAVEWTVPMLVDAGPAKPVEPITCTGVNRSGARCRNKPEPGSDRCGFHQIKAEEPEAA